MINRKHFPYVDEYGAIDILFVLEYINNEFVVNTIQVIGNYNTGISESPKLRFIDNEWKLISEKIEPDQQDATIIEEYNNDAAKFIIRRILEIKNSEPIP